MFFLQVYPHTNFMLRAQAARNYNVVLVWGWIICNDTVGVGVYLKRMEEQNKPWVIRMIDENEQLGPISAVVGIGVLSFVVVLGGLAWMNGPQTISYFGSVFEPFTSQRQDPSTPQGKDAVLAALAAGSPNSASEAEKLATLKSLAERIDNGEERIMLSEQQKLDVLASLRSAE